MCAHLTILNGRCYAFYLDCPLRRRACGWFRTHAELSITRQDKAYQEQQAGIRPEIRTRGSNGNSEVNFNEMRYNRGQKTQQNVSAKFLLGGVHRWEMP